MKNAIDYIILTPTGYYRATFPKTSPDQKSDMLGSDFRTAAPFANKLGAFRFAATIPGAQVWTRNGDKIRRASLPKGWK